MPSPQAAVAMASMPGNSENFQENVESVHAGAESGTKELSDKQSVSSADQMVLVMVDESKMQVQKYNSDKNTEEEALDEQKDGISLLINNWSTSSKPVLWRRDSCEFTNCVFPCVKKATSHLQQLKIELSKLNQDQSSLPPPETSSTDGSTSPCFEHSPTPLSEIRSSSAEQTSELSSPISFPSRMLTSIQEKSLPDEQFTSNQFQDSDPRTTSSQAKTHLSQPQRFNSSLYHMGYTVIEEVVRLLGRLERNRQNTLQMLTQEMQRVNLLKSQIDQLAFKRLVELPASVQEEHESCITDINELKWHCSYRGRLKTRITKRVDYAETQYGKFINDVESAKRSCPLVKEKLDLEALAIASIQSKQDETDEELRQTLQRLDATQKKTNEAKQRAAQERVLIKTDVDILRDLLNEVSDGLAQLKMNYTSNVHTFNDIKNTLKENAQQCLNLEKREERVKNQEAAAQDKVVKLRGKIAEQVAEHARLLEENEKLRKNSVETEEVYHSDISKIKMAIKSYQLQVREMARANKAIREELESTEKLLEKCNKQQKTDKRSLVRAAQEIEKVKQQNEMMSEETKKVTVLNTSLKASKLHEEALYFAEEETLRNVEMSLKSQLKEEGHMRTVLQARIASDTSDLLRSRIESTKKKEKVTEQAEDAVKIVTRIKEQVSKLEKARNERFQTISQLDEVLDKLAKQRNEMESKYGARITELRAKEDVSKNENSTLEQNLDEIAWKSARIEKRMSDMSSSTIMMTKVTASNKVDIAELEEDHKEMKIRLESSMETNRNLSQALEEGKERLQTRQDEHEKHIENRKSVLEGNLKHLQAKLNENKSLAENYQKLHCRFMQLKEDVFKDFESLVNEESNLKDHRELNILQVRMRECLQHYYKLRGLHNKAQVAQFKVHSKENNDKVFELKQELTHVVTHINNFLESNNAAHVAISVNAAAMTQTPVK